MKIKPDYGPYARVSPAGVASLNAAGQKLLETWFVGRKKPHARFCRKFPGLYRAAIAWGVTEDEIEAACLLGATRAVLTYKPACGFEFNVCAVWKMKSQVGKLLDQLTKPNRCGVRVTSGNAPMGHDPDAAELLTTLADDSLDPDATANAERLKRLARDVHRAIREAVPEQRDRDIYICARGLRGGIAQPLREIAYERKLSPATVGKIVATVEAAVKPRLVGFMLAEGE